MDVNKVQLLSIARSSSDETIEEVFVYSNLMFFDDDGGDEQINVANDDTVFEKVSLK